jgi:cell division protein FtsQ
VVETITVRGAVRADSASIAQLAGVGLGSPMKAVSAELVADRVRRHPWVQGASVSRQPTGSVLISLRERVPVALELDSQGRPSFFLDAEAFRMPVVYGRAMDLPVVRRLSEPYHPVTPLKQTAIRDFVALLPELEDVQDALLSEIHETEAGEIDIYTSTSPAGQSIRVQLGSEGFGEKLDLLQAFWMQSVLSRPTTKYEWIDLRFAGQVVVKERV